VKRETKEPITPEQAREAWQKRRYDYVFDNINHALERCPPAAGLMLLWEDVTLPMPGLSTDERRVVWKAYRDAGFDVVEKTDGTLAFAPWVNVRLDYDDDDNECDASEAVLAEYDKMGGMLSKETGRLWYVSTGDFRFGYEAYKTQLLRGVITIIVRRRTNRTTWEVMCDVGLNVVRLGRGDTPIGALKGAVLWPLIDKQSNEEE